MLIHSGKRLTLMKCEVDCFICSIGWRDICIFILLKNQQTCDITMLWTVYMLVWYSERAIYYIQSTKAILPIVQLLAHLSRRLTWAYRMGLEPASVRACVHTFKHEYLRDQQADYNQILSEASLGWGKGCIRFWCRSDQNSGFHGNGYLP